VLTKREENQFLVFERKVLRTIGGPILENGVYRKKYNFELKREFDSPCVINIVKTNRLRYAGHMMKTRRPTTEGCIFIARPKGLRRKGRPKSRWADGVNSESRVVGVPDWTNRTQEREQWKELLRQALTANWL
jgi:hypothetical protein